MKYTTHVNGYNTLDRPPTGPEADQATRSFTAAHFVQFRIAGRAKEATVRKRAAAKGIVRNLRATAVSHGSSGKGRQVNHVII